MIPYIAKRSIKKNQSKEIAENYPLVVVYNKADNEEKDQLTGGDINYTGPMIYVSEHNMKVQIIKNGAGWGRIAQHEAEEIGLKNLVEVKHPQIKKIELDIYIMRDKNRALGPLCQNYWDSFKN